MAEKRNRWLINTVLILSVVAFVGFSVMPLLSSVLEQPKPQASASPGASPTARATPKKEDLENQAKGYEAVLQREPDNQTALRGLLEAKLGLGDVKGAIVPLEKLAKLNPTEADYSVLLAQAKQAGGRSRRGSPNLPHHSANQARQPECFSGLSDFAAARKAPRSSGGTAARHAEDCTSGQPDSGR